MNEIPVLIAHRGNVDGPSPNENTIKHIRAALRRGFNVEIDVFAVGDRLYLGHDAPNLREEVSLSFLKDDRIWCHAKGLDALVILMSNNIHCFWHQNDDFTLTSMNYIWTFPGKATTSKSVIVMPEKVDAEMIIEHKKICYGICSDYVLKYKGLIYDR